jgi:hypothetical protein
MCVCVRERERERERERARERDAERERERERACVHTSVCSICVGYRKRQISNEVGIVNWDTRALTHTTHTEFEKQVLQPLFEDQYEEISPQAKHEVRFLFGESQH